METLRQMTRRAEVWEEAAAMFEDDAPALADRIRGAIAGKADGEPVTLTLTTAEEEIFTRGSVAAALES